MTSLLGNLTCYSHYRGSFEDQSSYLPTDIANDLIGINYYTHNSWDFNIGHPLDSSWTWGITNTYRKGGFMSKLELNKDISTQTLEELKSYLWLDRQSRALFLEFGVYNPGANIFGFLTLTAEFLPTGGVMHHSHIQVLKANGGGFSNFLMNFFMGLLAIYFVCSFALEVQRMVKMRCRYWSEARHYSNWSILVMIVVTIVLFILRHMEVLKALQADNSSYAPLRVAALYDDMYKLCLGLLSFVVTLKVIFLLRLNRRLAVLLSMYQGTRFYIITFIPILIPFIASFSTLLYLTLCSKLFHFRNVPSAVITVIAAIFRCFDSNEVLAVDNGAGNWAFSMLVVGVIFFLTNAFVIVLIKGLHGFMLSPQKKQCTMDERAAEIIVRKVFGETNKTKQTQQGFKEAYNETMSNQMMGMKTTTL